MLVHFSYTGKEQLVPIHTFFSSLLLALCLLYPTLSFANQPQPSSPAAIKIGVILPLSGSFARYGEQIRKSLEKQKPTHVQYSFEDEGCNPTKAISSYKKLSSFDGLKLFLGPWCGSPQTAIAPLLRANNHFAMLGSSAPEGVFALSGKRMYSTQASIEAESRFNAEEMNKRKLASTVIVFRENEFSRAHEAAFRNTFQGKVLETLAYTSDDLGQLKSLALRIKQLSPKSLYIPDAFPLMAGFLTQLRLGGVSHLPTFSVYSAQSEDVLEAVGKDGEGLLYSYYDIGDADAVSLFSGQAAELLIKAAEACPQDDVLCIQKTMPGLAAFHHAGSISSGLILKTIHDGKFEKKP
jgi:ABC-type branched-subunit amino acid transport system substrate-binding protein